jgi:hypothetical protein
MPQIHFNGKTYNDLAEMPATEREAYEQLMAIFRDENQDGVPDIFQGDVIGNLLKAATTSVYVDGKQVSGLGEMTPEQRVKIEQGMAKLKEWGLISQIPTMPGYSRVPQDEFAEIRPSKPIIPTPSAIQEDSGPRLGVILAVALLLAVCVFGAVAYFLFQ